MIRWPGEADVVVQLQRLPRLAGVRVGVRVAGRLERRRPRPRGSGCGPGAGSRRSRRRWSSPAGGTRGPPAPAPRSPPPDRGRRTSRPAAPSRPGRPRGSRSPRSRATRGRRRESRRRLAISGWRSAAMSCASSSLVTSGSARRRARRRCRTRPALRRRRRRTCAIVAAPLLDSSSGWACTAIRRSEAWARCGAATRSRRWVGPFLVTAAGADPGRRSPRCAAPTIVLMPGGFRSTPGRGRPDRHEHPPATCDSRLIGQVRTPRSASGLTVLPWASADRRLGASARGVGLVDRPGRRRALSERDRHRGGGRGR